MSRQAKFAAMKVIEQYGVVEVLELLDKANLSECSHAIQKRQIDGAKLLSLDSTEVESWRRELNSDLVKRLLKFIDQLYDDPARYVLTNYGAHEELYDPGSEDEVVYQNHEDQRVVYSGDEYDESEFHEEIPQPPPPPRTPNAPTASGSLVDKLKKELNNRGFGLAIPTNSQPTQQPPVRIYGNDADTVNNVGRPYDHDDDVAVEYVKMAGNADVTNRRPERPNELPLHGTQRKDSLQLPKIITPYDTSPGSSNRPLPTLPVEQSASVEGGRRFDRSTSRVRSKATHNAPIISSQNEVPYDIPRTYRNGPVPDRPSSNQSDASTVIRKNSNVSRKPFNVQEDLISSLQTKLQARSGNNEAESESSYDSTSEGSADNENYIKPIETTASMRQSRNLPPVPNRMPQPPPPPRQSANSIERETYFKNITRAEASKLLHNKPDGTFLIRPSQQKHGYTLMVRFLGKDFNIKVRKRSDDKYASGEPSDGELAFNSVQSMIKYYSYGIEKLALFTSEKHFGETYLYPIGDV